MLRRVAFIVFTLLRPFIPCKVYGKENIKNNKTLYICNHQSCKIRTIDLKNYTVSDYKEFEEPIYKYLRTNDREIVELESGVYML